MFTCCRHFSSLYYLFLVPCYLMFYFILWVFLVPSFLVFYSILWISMVSTFYIYRLHLRVYLMPCFLICNIWCSIFHILLFLYCFIYYFPLLTPCLFFSGSSWYFLFLAYNSLCHFADNCSFFNEPLMVLLAFTLQSTFINFIWKYRVLIATELQNVSWCNSLGLSAWD